MVMSTHPCHPQYPLVAVICFPHLQACHFKNVVHMESMACDHQGGQFSLSTMLLESFLAFTVIVGSWMSRSPWNGYSTICLVITYCSTIWLFQTLGFASTAAIYNHAQISVWI